MEAYDKLLIGGFLASPAFRRRYGTSIIVNHDGTTSHDLSASWQAALVTAAFSTETLGLLLNGFVTDRYGYRKVMTGALIFMNLAVFVSFFATSLEMLLASQILAGMYLPSERRPFLTRSRLTMGSLSNSVSHICCGSIACRLTDLSPRKCQYVLAHRPSDRNGYCPRLGHK